MIIKWEKNPVYFSPAVAWKGTFFNDLLSVIVSKIIETGEFQIKVFGFRDERIFKETYIDLDQAKKAAEKALFNMVNEAAVMKDHATITLRLPDGKHVVGSMLMIPFSSKQMQAREISKLAYEAAWSLLVTEESGNEFQG